MTAHITPGDQPSLIVKKLVAGEFGVSVVDLEGASRRRDVVIPRAIAVYITRTMLHLSNATIGKLYGNRDHSTIMHIVKSVSEKQAQQPLITEKLIHLEKTVSLHIDRATEESRARIIMGSELVVVEDILYARIDRSMRRLKRLIQEQPFAAMELLEGCVARFDDSEQGASNIGELGAAAE